MIVKNLAVTTQLTNAGKPTMPLGRQPIVERKVIDPSSSPRVERYPIPSFFERRIKAKEHDTL